MLLSNVGLCFFDFWSYSSANNLLFQFPMFRQIDCLFQGLWRKVLFLNPRYKKHEIFQMKFAVLNKKKCEFEKIIQFPIKWHVNIFVWQSSNEKCQNFRNYFCIFPILYKHGNFISTCVLLTHLRPIGNIFKVYFALHFKRT